MAEVEKVDLVKAVTGPTTGVFWVKTILYGLAFSALVFVGFGVYKAYFKKPIPNQTITVAPGGQLDIHNEVQKKTWTMTVFIEPFVETSTERKMGAGIRGGLRIER